MPAPTKLTHHVVVSGDTAAERADALTRATEQLTADAPCKLDLSMPSDPVALSVRIGANSAERFADAIAYAVAAIAKGMTEAGMKWRDGSRVLVGVERGLDYDLAFSGDSAAELAAALERAASDARSTGVRVVDRVESQHAMALRLLVTRVPAPHSFDAALAVALRDVAAGIGAAGWNVDGGAAAELVIVRPFSRVTR